MLNERLKTLREARGLSQEQLATRVRIRQSHISRIESGSILHVRWERRSYVYGRKQ